MQANRLSAVELVRSCIARIEAIDRVGPTLRAVIEINEQAEEIAAQLDDERRHSRLRGALHGIPVLLKDNIETADSMHTTAGSLALLNAQPRKDAPVARKLRDAGAVLLGKANMSEWANFRSDTSSSGWSSRGGQALNPFVLDRSPCGSSSGSATAVAAGMAPVSLGTETCGSILCPASVNGVVGIKPTVGLTSRSGVVPIAHSQDTVGPFARTMADAALVLQAISGADPRDAATAGAAGIAWETGSTDVRGMRVGVCREGLFGNSAEADAIADAAIEVLSDLGVEVVDGANIPSLAEMQERRVMIEVLLYEFKADLNTYLQSVAGDIPVRSLAELIAFNRDHAAEEMPFFGQEIFERAEGKGPLTEPAYLEALETSRRLSREEGIDAVMDALRLDALTAPTTGPAFLIDHEQGDKGAGGSAMPAAMAGYPAISVPAGLAGPLPVGITLFGGAYSERTLIRLAHAYETAAGAWRPPSFLPGV